MNVLPLQDVLASLESGARPPGGVSADSGEIVSLGGEHLNSDGGFDFTAIKRIPRSFFEAMRGGRIAPRDILVVKDGATTGKTSFVREDFPYREAPLRRVLVVGMVLAGSIEATWGVGQLKLSKAYRTFGPSSQTTRS